MKCTSATARLITQRPVGHTLNKRQVLSPDRQWCVFDTRNHDPDIGITQSIERVNLGSGVIELLYSTATSAIVGPPTEFGPGVGAAAYHPQEDRIVFIHGLHNCSASQPYGMARRYGAILDVKSKEIRSLESRRVGHPIPFGTLSGGTHAHSWSPSGERVSFTYDDALNPDRARTVGWGDLTIPNEAIDLLQQSPGFPVEPPIETASIRGKVQFNTGEEFNGASSCYLLRRCDANAPIRQAVEECWVGDNQIAFWGRIPCKHSGHSRMEVFLATLPSREQLIELTGAHANAMHSGLEHGTPPVEELCNFRQLTNLIDAAAPTEQAPRHWLMSDEKGEWIYFLHHDGQGTVQLFRVGTHTGQLECLTNLKHSVEGQFSISRDGMQVSFVSNGRIHLLNLDRQEIQIVEEVDFRDVQGEKFDHNLLVGGWVGAPHFVDPRSCLINRYVKFPQGDFLQIVHVALN